MRSACIAEGTADRLPSGYRTQAEDAGAILIEGGADRAALVRDDPGAPGPALGTPETSDEPDAAAVAHDFLALGTAAGGSAT